MRRIDAASRRNTLNIYTRVDRARVHTPRYIFFGIVSLVTGVPRY